MVKVSKLEVKVCRNAACKSKVRASTCAECFVCAVFLCLADELTSARLAAVRSVALVAKVVAMVFPLLYFSSNMYGCI